MQAWRQRLGHDHAAPRQPLQALRKDGQKLEVIARGFRAPNGMCVGPHGEMTTGDNEGTWTPIVPHQLDQAGRLLRRARVFAAQARSRPIRDNPLCWLPHQNPKVDNSSGGQVWITGNKFGPLSGQLLQLSYGTCKLFNVLKEEVGRPNARRRRRGPQFR